MSDGKTVANRLREVLLNGKWVANTNYKEQLSNVSWKQAIQRTGNLNSIALLTFHINYYIAGLLQVLDGGPLDIKDKYSFDMPPLLSEDDWKKMVENFLENAESFAGKIEQMDSKQLHQPFIDEKYGTWLRNIDAIIEHSYYHLGQISLIRKLLNEGPFY